MTMGEAHKCAFLEKMLYQTIKNEGRKEQERNKLKKAKQ